MTRSSPKHPAEGAATPAVAASADPTSQQIVSLATACIALARSVTVSSCFGMLTLSVGLIVPQLSDKGLAGAFRADAFAARVLAVGSFMLGALLGQWLERFMKERPAAANREIRALQRTNHELVERIEALEEQLERLRPARTGDDHAAPTTDA